MESKKLKKEIRQNKILSIIKNNKIKTQSDLLDYLKNDNVRATQATLSRDIKELNIVKHVDVDGNSIYTLMDEKVQKKEIYDQIHDVFQETILNISVVEFINIIKTNPNDANRLAAMIDESHIQGIVGTIAGYDTIVLFSKDKQKAQDLNKTLKDFLQ